MATLLLIVIYIAFIGLGIPDSLFGAAWPAIYGEYAIPVSYANFVSLTSAVCMFLSSLYSPKLINNLGTDKVTAVSTAVTAAGLLTISVTHNFALLVLLAIPLGFGAGAIDSGLNNYVALHYNAMQMNFLHCFYGVGVSISPYLLSFALESADGWRGGYLWVGLLQVAIAAVVLLTLPLWKMHSAGIDQEEVVTLSLRKQLKVKGFCWVLLMFFASCGIELCCGNWSSTFLVEQRNMPEQMAARMVTLYFIGLAMGRFLSGLLSLKMAPRRVIWIGMGLLAVAVLLLMLPVGNWAAAVGLLLAGIGVGPVYPNLMYLTPVLFGRQVSQSMVGTQMAAACLGIMLPPALFGVIADVLSPAAYPYYLLILLVLLMLAAFGARTAGKENADVRI